MGFQIDSSTINALEKLNAACTFRHQSPTLARQLDGSHQSVGPGHIVCDIVDRTTGKIYVSHPMPMDAPNACESEALRQAIEIARTAPKPLTAAQESDPRYTKLNETIDENKRLREELEQLRAQLSESPDSDPAPRPRGRPRKPAPDAAPEPVAESIEA